jgi:hypothetical protein
MIRRKPKARKSVKENPLTGTRRIGKEEMSPELLALIKRTPPGGLSDDIIDEAFWLSDDSNIAPPRYAGPPPAKKPKAKKKYAVNLSAEEWPWVQALDQFDRHGDEKPLQQLLESGCKPSPRVSRYLEDLKERRKARKGKSTGRPKTPAYMLSDIDVLLLIACDCVRGHVQRGDSVDAALDKVVDEFRLLDKDGREFHLNKDRLDDCYNGRRPSLRKSRNAF